MTEEAATPAPAGAGGRGARSAAAALVLAAVVLCLTAWSLASPLMTGPDEPSHMTQAAALVRGQFDEPTRPTAVGNLSFVHVPFWVFDVSTLANCVAFKARIPASCQAAAGSGTRTVTQSTQFSNYPPLYFVLTGLPTLVLRGVDAVWAMRSVSILANALLMALGVVLLVRHHPRRAAPVGVLVALTPMALFISGVLNTSGLEVSAALATWCGGLCLASGAAPATGLVAGTAVAGAVLALARPTGPLFLAVIAVTLALYAGWRRSAALVRSAAVRPLWAVGGAAVIVAGVFYVTGGPLHLVGHPARHPVSTSAALQRVRLLMWPRLRDAIGNFGWTDTLAPHWTVVAFVAAGLALLAYGLVRSLPCWRALPFLVAATVAIRLALELPHVNQVGYSWQGRYWLPMLMGLPLLAAAAGGEPREHSAGSPRLRLAGAAIIAAAVVAAQIDAFLQALRRYRIGLGPGPHLHPPWSPPAGSAAVITLFVAGQVALAAVVVWHAGTRGRRPAPGAPAEPEGPSGPAGEPAAVTA